MCFGSQPKEQCIFAIMYESKPGVSSLPSPPTTLLWSIKHALAAVSEHRRRVRLPLRRAGLHQLVFTAVSEQPGVSSLPCLLTTPACRTASTCPRCCVRAARRLVLAVSANNSGMQNCINMSSPLCRAARRLVLAVSLCPRAAVSEQLGISSLLC